MRRIIVGLALFFISTQASAVFFEPNLFYFSDSLSHGSSAAASRTFLDGALGFNIDRKGFFQAGWEYGSFSTSDSNNGTTTYTASATGPKFNFYMGRHNTWS